MRPNRSSRRAFRGESSVPVTAEHRCTLDYMSSFNSTAAANFAYVNYVTNTIYDPPQLGSDAPIAYKDELVNMYFNFRVISYSGTLTLINRETFPVAVFLLQCNTNPGALGGNFLTAAGQPFSQSGEMSGVGSPNKISFRFSHTVKQIAGTPATNFDASYAGNSSADPTDKTWLSVQFSSLGAGNISVGITGLLRIKYHVLFYGRRADVYTVPKLISTNTQQNLTSEAASSVVEKKIGCCHCHT